MTIVTKPRYKYSIACCARWEHEDVLEWVSYHKSIGFDHIYLMSNDDDPMPTFKVLTPFLFGPEPFVTFKHIPKPHQDAAQQAHIYKFFMDTYLAETEWFTFIDVDEFYVLKFVNNIHNFMREFEDDVDAVYFNWLIYGHSGKAERDHESLLLSHTQRSTAIDVHTKMMTRSSKIDPDAIMKAFSAGGRKGFWHFWSDYQIPGMRQVNVIGDSMDEYGIDFPNRALEYSRRPGIREAIIHKAYIAHYQFRSEADVRRRVDRGGSLTNKYWKSKVDDGSYMKLFSGRNAVWDDYMARYWLNHAGAAYDIVVSSPETSGLINLALRKPNIQSSWHTPTPEDPPRSHAQGHANNGIRTGSYGFRTRHEEAPWWMVDLLDISNITTMHIYRDTSSPEAARTAEHLSIDISYNTATWTEIFKMTPEVFEAWPIQQKLVVRLEPTRRARYVRISSTHPTELRLDEVEVYGPPASAT